MRLRIAATMPERRDASICPDLAAAIFCATPAGAQAPFSPAAARAIGSVQRPIPIDPDHVLSLTIAHEYRARARFRPPGIPGPCRSVAPVAQPVQNRYGTP